MICKHCNAELIKCGSSWQGNSGWITCTVLTDDGKYQDHEPAEPAAAPQELCFRCNQQVATRRCHQCDAPLCDHICEEWHLEKDCEPAAPADSTPQLTEWDMDIPKNNRFEPWPLKPNANSTRPEPLSELEMCKKIIAWANNSLYGSHGYFLSMNGGEPNEHHLDSQIEVIKRHANKAANDLAALKAAAPRTQGSELECKHCGQTIRPAKDSKVRGYWIGTNNYLTCPNNVGQPHEPLAAQPQPAPRTPVCPKCGSELCVIADTDPSDYQCFAPAVTCQNGKCDYKVFPGWEAKNWLELFAASPAPLPLAQAADEVLAELSLLNGKFTQKQNALFDKVREFTAIPAQKEEE